MTTQEQFADACEALMGTPFRHRGRNHAGLDCRGLFLVGAEDANVQPPIVPFDDYEPQPDPAILLREVQARFHPAHWDERHQPGRVLVLRQRNGAAPKHFAVTIREKGWAVHQDSRKVTRWRVHDEFVHSVWRVPGVTYKD